MHECVKCKTLIKPASLAVFAAGEAHHPQCLSCKICDKLLFGKPFKRNKNGTLQCESPCQPKPQPVPAQQAPITGATSYEPGNPYHDVEMYRKVNNNSQMQTQKQDLTEMYRKTPIQRYEELVGPILNNSQQPDSYLSNKLCKLCNQSVIGRRFITYENGDIICYDCDMRSAVRPPRIKSAHIIICSFCNSAIHGRRYLTEPNGKILCEKCELNAPKCYKCARPISLDINPRILSNNTKYHPECFNCSSCNNLISEPEFFESKSNEPLCLNCFEQTKLPKCIECKKSISSGYFMIDNNPIHKECFKCNQCNEQLSPENGFFKNPVTNMPICQKCHLLNTAPKCAKCGRSVDKDGCTYANKDYHQNCFVCVHCNVQLMKMKTTYRGKTDDEIMCEPCFVDRYAPKCAKCTQPISPHIPGTKYDDKMYHLECLACGRCKKTLANKKFFKVGNIQICESCY